MGSQQNPDPALPASAPGLHPSLPRGSQRVCGSPGPAALIPTGIFPREPRAGAVAPLAQEQWRKIHPTAALPPHHTPALHGWHCLGHANASTTCAWGPGHALGHGSFQHRSRHCGPPVSARQPKSVPRVLGCQDRAPLGSGHSLGEQGPAHGGDNAPSPATCVTHFEHITKPSCERPAGAVP